MSVLDSPDSVSIPKVVIPTGAGAQATAQWRNLLFACILGKIEVSERVAQAFDLAASATRRVPRSSRPLRRAGVGNACASGVDHAERHDKQNSTGCIVARPCQKRKGRGTHALIGNR